jgi:uncharacterized protein YbjT (DUF2867 family)
VILLTGATGAVGTALLRRLVQERRPVRCLVRDPRRLGPDRMRVALALGDLTDPPSFRNALRGVRAVVHLAQTRRDQPRGSIEEVDAIATWRLVEAAERAGAERFVLLSDLAASPTDRTRFRRAKAVAEEAVLGSSLHASVLAPSFVAGRVRPLVVGRSTRAFEPVTPGDVAAAALAALDGPGGRVELRGPEAVGRDALVARLAGRAPVRLPEPIAERGLRAVERLLGERTPLTWDEVELLV